MNSTRTPSTMCANTHGTLCFRADFNQILSRVALKQGLRTTAKVSTLPGRSIQVEATVEPFYRDAVVLLSPPLPSVLLSSHRATHRLSHVPQIRLVKVMLNPLSDDIRVFKLCTGHGGSRLAREVEFMTGLPEVGFLLRTSFSMTMGFFTGCSATTIPHCPSS
jgi:hypothetical protein